jgi:hypothetical protein
MLILRAYPSSHLILCGFRVAYTLSVQCCGFSFVFVLRLILNVANEILMILLQIMPDYRQNERERKHKCLISMIRMLLSMQTKHLTISFLCLNHIAQ